MLKLQDFMNLMLQTDDVLKIVNYSREHLKPYLEKKPEIEANRSLSVEEAVARRAIYEDQKN